MGCVFRGRGAPKTWPVTSPEKKRERSRQPAEQEGAPVIPYRPRRGTLHHLRAAVDSVCRFGRKVLNARPQGWNVHNVGHDFPQIAPSARLWPKNDIMDRYGSRRSNDAASGDRLRTTAERTPQNEVRPSTFRRTLSHSIPDLDSVVRPRRSAEYIRAAAIERRSVRIPSEASRCSEIQPAEASEPTSTLVLSKLVANDGKPGLRPALAFGPVTRPSERAYPVSRRSEIQRAEASDQRSTLVPSNMVANVEVPGLGPPPAFGPVRSPSQQTSQVSRCREVQSSEQRSTLVPSNMFPNVGKPSLDLPPPAYRPVRRPSERASQVSRWSEIQPAEASEQTSTLVPSGMFVNVAKPGLGPPPALRPLKRSSERASQISRCSEIQPAEASEQTSTLVLSKLLANLRHPGLKPPPAFVDSGRRAKSSLSAAKRFGEAPGVKTLGISSPAQIRTTDLDSPGCTRLQHQPLVTFATPYQSPDRVTAAWMDRGSSSTHVRNEDRSRVSHEYATAQAFLKFTISFCLCSVIVGRVIP